MPGREDVAQLNKEEIIGTEERNTLQGSGNKRFHI
jgi:hypothetical protein